MEHVKKFYQTFSDLKSTISIPVELKDYAVALYKHHKITLKSVKTYETKNIFPDVETLIDKNAILCFSGGMDSAATLLWAINNGYTVYPVFFEGLNTTSSKEKKAVVDICERYQVQPTFLKHNSSLKSITTYKKHGMKENPAKNQYLWLSVLPLMVSNKCKTILFGNEQEFEGEYFSDMYESFELFKDYAEALLGLEINFLTAFTDKKYCMKYIFENDPDMFSLTYSCYMPLRFFALHNEKTSSPPNMCGNCFKCKRIKRLADEIKVDLQ
jgi:7-cyano-7-deazaguanine synthase in queuosine biosynthesis